MLLVLLFAGLWRCVYYAVRVGIAVAFLSIVVASWLLVILVGILHPHLTPRKACDAYSLFLQHAADVIQGGM